MKAKQWVQALTPLSQAGEERTEEFLEQVELLADAKTYLEFFPFIPRARS